MSTHRALAVGSLLLSLVACAPPAADPRLGLLEEQTRVLMIGEAQQAVATLLHGKLDPSKARLVTGSEVEQWLVGHGHAPAKLPEPFNTTVKAGKEVALLISDGVTGKDGRPHAVMYLRPSRFGFHHRLVLDQPDPCGDGNPAMCDNCTGCSGESEPGGTIHTCVCTLSCDVCNVCPNC